MTDQKTGYEPCEECGAPLDPQQRYCVQCAARRRNGANPSSQYFAAMSKRAHRPAVRLPAKASSGSRAAAVGFFALLPIAVAIGVVVGRSGSDGDNEALLEALHRQESAFAASPAQTATAAASPGGKSEGKAAAKPAKGGGKVVAHTENGEVHQIAGYAASKEKTAEDTHLVETNVKQVGDNYVKAQQNLPDVIVVGGDPGSAPPAPGGSQP